MESFRDNEVQAIELDLVAQKRVKPYSTEIITEMMEPNEEFWKFLREINIEDLEKACFTERISITKEQTAKGILQVSISKADKQWIAGEEHHTFIAEAKTLTLTNPDAKSAQSVKVCLTDKMQLICESRYDRKPFGEIYTETKYEHGLGYQSRRSIVFYEDLDPDIEIPPFATNILINFRCNELKAIMTDVTTFFLGRIMSRCGEYEIEIPHLDIENQTVIMSSLRSLGYRQLKQNGITYDLVGIKRTHHFLNGSHIYNVWLFQDGHVAHRDVEQTNATFRQLSVLDHIPLIQQDEDDVEPNIKLDRLDWHGDMQLRSIYRDRAAELSRDHTEYIQKNEVMMKLLRDFYTSVLAHKPNNVYDYAKTYFNSYSP